MGGISTATFIARGLLAATGEVLIVSAPNGTPKSAWVAPVGVSVISAYEDVLMTRKLAGGFVLAVAVPLLGACTKHLGSLSVGSGGAGGSGTPPEPARVHPARWGVLVLGGEQLNQKRSLRQRSFERRRIEQRFFVLRRRVLEQLVLRRRVLEQLVLRVHFELPCHTTRVLDASFEYAGELALPIGGVTVAVQDANGNTVTSATNTVTLTIGANPGSSNLLGYTTATPVKGVATFSAVGLDEGGYRIHARRVGHRSHGQPARRSTSRSPLSPESRPVFMAVKC